jgi:hypothetical protein
MNEGRERGRTRAIGGIRKRRRELPAEVSPDGRTLALFNIGARQEDLFVSPVGSFSPRRVTDDAARDRGPVRSTSPVW